jgi:hypothetical protein
VGSVGTGRGYGGYASTTGRPRSSWLRVSSTLRVCCQQVRQNDISTAPRPRATSAPSLDTALAACSLLNLDGPAPLIQAAIDWLVVRQDEDGFWPCHPLYWGAYKAIRLGLRGIDDGAMSRGAGTVSSFPRAAFI